MELSSSSERQYNATKPSEDERDKSDKTYHKYIERISTLPVWGEDPRDKLYKYQNFWFSHYYLERIMFAQEHFRAQSSDIILSSAPKTGTTWLKALAFSIVTRNCFDDSMNPLLTSNPHDCVPFVEVDLAQNPPNRHLDHPLISTHIPYISLPESIIASGCKIIYICRDPKDVFVSMWQFACKVTQPIPLEMAFEMFCGGMYLYGPYLDHVLGYWKASLERPDMILFLKYEDLKRDTMSNLKTLAKFMGQPFSEEEERNGVSEKIIQLCSFEHLSNLEVNKSGKHRPEAPITVPNNAFFRNGKVGDSENHLTLEMKKCLDGIMEEKLRDSGLNF
ncbi:unnamed protein product [Ilex paraguariensis]|uniref:Sulfotransferase n=1 Tax=Ilex paraguariensis TaxID=185542 RepID=A0ABC8SUM1_9AQUA